MPVADYDLAATLTSGQAFRWNQVSDAWEGIVAGHWVQLTQVSDGIQVRAAQPMSDWAWLAHYLQTEVALDAVLATFPADPHLRAATHACRGLRLLRQDPWECLASFILSSTKQIVQIRQIVARLCERFGQPIPVPPNRPPAFAFPTAQRLARCAESDLRECKMGFRARHLHAAARMVAEGELNLSGLGDLDEAQARAELIRIPGIGPKIANCVLLFAYGFPRAFPVDVWILRALRQYYFPRRRPTRPRLEKFVAEYFGPHAGYAQQYLFHYIRLRERRPVKRPDNCPSA
jgi:N-glycosylase/DNA lyase